VERGKIVSLLGPSGCGKTTTLRVIAGFEHPDSGMVRIDGLSMRRRRPYERNVGLLFQDYALFPHMTVAENISYGPRVRRTKSREVKQRVEALLGLTRLSGLEGRRPAELSGGQQQRAALARALATNPQLLLLDEPLSALDAKLRQELQIELKELLATIGTTTIIVTHDQDEAMALSERVIVMNGGRIIQDGSPTEIYRRPRSRFVAEFIGRSNWFAGRHGEWLGPNIQAFHTRNGQRLAVLGDGNPGGGSVAVCIRPEHITLTASEMPAGSTPVGTTVLKGRIITTIQLGAFAHDVVEIGPAARLRVVRQDRSTQPLADGDRVWLSFSAQDCIQVPAAEAVPIEAAGN
jgi:putative spermidine/putrescine transport system ATP-binding protein/putrescine transport system ATP-binding protein